MIAENFRNKSHDQKTITSNWDAFSDNGSMDQWGLDVNTLLNTYNRPLLVTGTPSVTMAAWTSGDLTSTRSSIPTTDNY